MDEKIPESEVVTHEELFDGIIVRLHRDVVRYPSGRTAVREVVLHPGGVCAVPVLPDGRILLIRQFRYPLKRFILELPAGKLDSGQPPEATIARELEEETGHRAGRLTYACAFYTSPGISNELIHLFIARELEPVPQRLDEGEHITLEPHTTTECLAMIDSGEIVDGKTSLGLLWWERHAGRVE